MAFRGSLRQCIELMVDQFRRQNYPRLNIVRVPRGKYYTLLTEDELKTLMMDPMPVERILICDLSPRELLQFVTNSQLQLFGKEEHADDQDPV